jgi:hypothetical protein
MLSYCILRYRSSNYINLIKINLVQIYAIMLNYRYIFATELLPFLKPLYYVTQDYTCIRPQEKP